jgi:hypothetical protein
MQKDTLQYHHEGHPGTAETTRFVREEFFWPGFCLDVQNHMHACTTCATAKGRHPITSGPLRENSWETIALELMGPYLRSTRGKRFILVATDMFSRWIEAFQIAKAILGTIAPFLQREVFLRWGFPQRILTATQHSSEASVEQVSARVWVPTF